MGRSTDALNSCKTLDDLCAGLLKEGYVLSRQTFHLRLIPKRVDYTKATRHLRIVPVKLLKAQNSITQKRSPHRCRLYICIQGIFSGYC